MKPRGTKIFKTPGQEGTYTCPPASRFSRSVYSDTKSDPLTHLEFNAPRHTFSNHSTIDVIYNAKNRSWQDIHDSISTTTTRELFDTDFVSHENQPLIDSIRINILFNKHCMSELLLLYNTQRYYVYLIQVQM